VREDYSPDRNAREFLTHDMARSKAYRWGEDGIAGICDLYQLLVFALALWNGRDSILKERMFGLSGNEGNHGEDVKEYWFAGSISTIRPPIATFGCSTNIRSGSFPTRSCSIPIIWK